MLHSAGVHLKHSNVCLCSTEYHFPADENAGGERAPNGTWTGVFGLFQRRETEVSNVVFSMTARRMDVVDFSFPVLGVR
jgi:hypothetical protein